MRTEAKRAVSKTRHGAATAKTPRVGARRWCTRAGIAKSSPMVRRDNYSRERKLFDHFGALL